MGDAGDRRLLSVRDFGRISQFLLLLLLAGAGFDGNHCLAGSPFSAINCFLFRGRVGGRWWGWGGVCFMSGDFGNVIPAQGIS